MRVVLHGSLERFGKSFDMATKVPAEALEGLSRQIEGWPRDLLVDVINFQSFEKLVAETDEEEIHLVPAMYGGGGVAKIVVGAILIAVAIIIPGPWSPYLISMGASLVLSGVMQLFMKAPTTSKSNDPDASKYLGINENTTAIGTPITLAWGTVKLGGHWLSLQSDSNQLVLGNFPVTPT